MKVTLISPYPDIQAFGLRTLSACLKREGHVVQIIFLPRSFTRPYADEELDQVVQLSCDADLIGISLMTNFFDNVVQITRRLKEKSGVPVMWGGIHPTVRPAECLDHADIVCIGEGEATVVELVRRMEGGRDYRDVRGLWLKDDGRIVANADRPAIPDLDSIPFPDYDGATHYVLDGGCLQRMSDVLLKKYTGSIYMTMPTRGCPFGCTYCCNNTLNEMHPDEKPVRKRSAGHLITELTQVRANLPVMEYIKFDDDAFFLYTLREMRDFCEQYKQYVGLPLIATGATPSTLSREKLSLLVDAGLTMVRMGIQTASERTNQLYGRRHSNEQVEKAVQIIHEFSDRIPLPQYDIILDNPWEADEDLIETLLFMTRLPMPYALALYSLTFYPGTALYEKAKDDGLIADDLTDVYRKYYHGCRKTYLNRLFFLLNDHARLGKRLSLQTMAWLTNRKLRRAKVSWLLYVALRIRLLPYFVEEGLRDIWKGNWSRIARYIREKL
jgi:radical SAM superfamily enzyme YgiQ (UPF0313 family)